MYVLTELPFKMDALEPFMSKTTMQYHYGKHHQGYVNKLNEVIKNNYPKLFENTEIHLLKNLNMVPSDIRQKVLNLGGGVVNHTFFWSILQRNEGALPTGSLMEAIEKQWGSFKIFKSKFSNLATSIFGSGWAWLALNAKKELEIMSTPNQYSPLEKDLKPILTLDVWEHAYYLDYQNRRADFISKFWEIIKWEQVSKNYEQALTK